MFFKKLFRKKCNRNIKPEVVLYKEAIAEEKLWRKDKTNKNDIELIDQLLKKLNKAGFKYKYYADITNRNNNDKTFAKIVLEYIGLFQDEGISAELVGVIGQKGNTFATETILNDYFNTSKNNKWKNAIFYDNALYRINDKRYISEYLKLLCNPNDAIKLPLTMIMLGKWKCIEAKSYFFDYLESDLFYVNKKTSDLVFIAIEALSYYDDNDGKIRRRISEFLSSDDKDIIKTAEKSLNRLYNNATKEK